MPTSPTPTASDLLDARDNWGPAQWDSHFTALGVRPAGIARYNAGIKGGGDNDVLKIVLMAVQGRRCWFQGSHGCQSRSLLPRDAQIDHVISQTALAGVLSTAIDTSTYQERYFDVHDPGNLAIICGPCNQEKSGSVLPLATPAVALRRERFEKTRDRVIAGVGTWYRNSKLDGEALRAIQSVDLTTPEARDIYADVIAGMIDSLATAAGPASSNSPMQDTTVETDSYRFEVRPSDSAVQAYVEMMEETAAEDARHGI